MVSFLYLCTIKKDIRLLIIVLMTSLSTNVTPQGAVLVGNRMFILPYTDGATDIHFLYSVIHTSPILNRCLLV